MEVIVAASDELKAELTAQGLQDSCRVEWIRDAADFLRYPGSDGYIDLLFEPSEERIRLLQQLPAHPVVIGSVLHTLGQLPAHFIRINHWPGFLRRPLVEAAADTTARAGAERIFAGFGKQTAWTPDVPGFLTARVVAMIINEAYMALEEKVSSRPEIDTAMKLGTNYPYGPFEWCGMTGAGNIYGLLEKLSREQPRYTASPLLKQEAAG